MLCIISIIAEYKNCDCKNTKPMEKMTMDWFMKNINCSDFRLFYVILGLNNCKPVVVLLLKNIQMAHPLL